MKPVMMYASFLMAALAAGQTTVDLRTQSKNVDFSAAPSTSPFKVGSTLPSSCTAGNAFFQSTAQAGQNLYLCTSTNTWTQASGGSGGGGGGMTLPFTTVATSGMVSIVNGSPAVYGCNGLDSAEAAGSTTVTPAAGSATETLLIGISCSDNRLKLIAPTNTFTCTPAGFAGCDSITGSNFTDGVIPLSAVAMMTNGSGSFTFGAVTDLRAPIQDDPPTVGVGLVYSKSGAARTVSVDTTQIPLLATSSDFTEITTPAHPSSGHERVYAKASAGLCAQDSTGTERCTGNGTGSTTTETFDLPASTCNAGSDGRLLWWTTASTAAGACDGTSAVGELAFGTSGSATGRPHMAVPLGWNGGEVDIYIYGRNLSEAASTFHFQTQCYSNSSTSSPAVPGTYNAAQPVTTSPNATSGFFLTKLASLTMTGCSAGNILDILVTKTSTSATDAVEGVYITFVRSL